MAEQNAAAEPQPEKSGWLADTAKSLASGVARGASELAMTPATLSHLANRSFNDASDTVEAMTRRALGMEPVSEGVKAARAKAQSEAGFGVAGWQDKARGALDAQLHKPETRAGRYANTVGEMIPGAVAMPGSVPLRAINAIRYGVAPGVASEGAGEATKGMKLEPAARFLAGLAGSLAGPAIVNAPARAISPLPIAAARQPLVDTLRREGVEMTAGQATGSKPLQWTESVLSDTPFAGKGAERIAERQRSQFTNAALGRMGVAPVEGQLATPEVMRGGARAIGDRFNDLSSRNVMAADQPFRSEISRVRTGYENASIPSQQRPVVQNTLGDLLAAPWGLHGERYQNIRSTLSKQAEGFRFADPPAAEALRGARNAMDAAMTRSVSPADAAAWTEARGQYGNMKVIEKALGGAGEQTAHGAVSPLQLRTAAAARSNSDYVRGQGDLAELAHAGAGVLPPPPNSGTAPRQQAMHTITALQGGGAVGAALAGHPVAAVASLAAPAIAGRALMSPAVQAYLANQLAAGARVATPAGQRAAAAGAGAIGSRALSDMFAPRELRAR